MSEDWLNHIKRRFYEDCTEDTVELYGFVNDLIGRYEECAMDATDLYKQTEQLESELDKTLDTAFHMEGKVHELESENKRLREALKLIRKQGTAGTHILTGKVWRTAEADIAEKALRGDNNV